MAEDYIFDVQSSGSWSDANNWFNQSTEKADDGTPGIGDTADIYAFFGTTTTVDTGGQSVADVYATGQGTIDLTGGGLNVAGDMRGVYLLSGTYSVGGEATDTTLMGGKLSGGNVGGTNGASGGFIVKGGTVTQSTTFWGAVYSGMVKTAKLIGVSLKGGTVKADTVVISGDGNGTVSGGELTDNGALTLVGQSQDSYAFLSISGGAATVGGVATVGNFGVFSVNGNGKATLANGLNVAQASGDVSSFSVGSSVAPGGKVTITTGHVIFGGSGKANIGVSKGGVLNAAQSNVVLAQLAPSTSTVTVNGGKIVADSLIVGKKGTGTLVVSGGGVSRNTLLEVGAAVASSGTITVSGDSHLVTKSLSIGGTTTAQGGSGLVDIRAEAYGQCRDLTIWKTGEVKVSGLMKVLGDATGNGVLQIGQGGQVNMSASVGASLQVEFSGAGALELFEPQRFGATIKQIADGASIKVFGFVGAHEAFVENSAHTRGTVFLTGAGTLPMYDSLHFSGNFNATEFHWNAATATLTCHP